MKNTCVAALMVCSLAGSAALSAPVLLTGSTNIFVDTQFMGFGTGAPTAPIDVRSDDVTGMSVVNVLTSGVRYGLQAETRSTQGRAVFGHSTATTGTGIGVYGRALGTQASGVFGEAASPSGATYGVNGRAVSPVGTGVLGSAVATTGANFGVAGLSSSTGGTGVYGNATAASGATYGVHGRAVSPNGTGVFGNAAATTGPAYGVYGRSLSPSGTGVFGRADSGTGVSGRTHTGTAVFGESTGTGFAGMFLGDLVVDGLLGVNEADPRQPLHVVGDGRIENGQFFVNATDNDVSFADQSQLFVSSNLGFPLYIQRVNRHQLFYVDFEGTVFARRYASLSDERTKQDVKPIEDALGTVLSMEGVTFEWRDDQPGAGAGRRVGLIAQDVERVLPEVVTETDSGYKGVEYASLVAVLIEATKAQQAEIEQQRLENDELRRLLGELAQRVEALEADGR